MPKEGTRDKFFTELGYLGFTPEVRFMPGRKFRWDMARDDLKIAVEYSGITGGVTGHSSWAGLTRDAEKFTEGAILGWLIVICNVYSVRTGAAMGQVIRAIEARGGTI